MFAYDNLILFNQLQSCLPTVATWQINPSPPKNTILRCTYGVDIGLFFHQIKSLHELRISLNTKFMEMLSTQVTGFTTFI